MKTTVSIIVMCAAFCGHTLAQTNQVSSVITKPPTQIVTADGDIYEGVKIIKSDPAGLTISYKMQGGGMGISHLAFDILPEWFQHKYHYEPKAAADFKTEQAQGNAQLVEKMEADEKIRQQVELEREKSDEAARRQIELDKISANLEQQRIEIAKKQAEAALAQAQNPNQPSTVNQQVQQQVH